MTTPHPEDSERLNDPAFQELLVNCLEKLEKGEDFDREALLRDHPDYAKDLAAFLDDRDLLAELAGSLHDAPSSQVLPGISAVLAKTILSAGEKRSLPPGERVRYIGEYEILREVARGGMGIVYKARQRKLKRIVALKMILSGRLASPEDVSRFQREAQAAARIKHPRIVPIHEIGQHEGQAYFTMDFVEGASLANLIRDEALPPKRAAELISQVAAAIHYAHEQGIVHRDLKPANILLDETGQPHVTDFGLAKIFAADPDDSEKELTLSGQILGTPSYMSPEQASGKHQLVGPTSDVYSLGAILYASLTGRAPFVAESTLDTIRQVASAEPLSPRALNPKIPRDLETICLKCLEKEPHKRYGTAELLADDLKRFREGRPVMARPVSPLAKSWRWCKRNSLVASLMAIVLLVLLAGIASTSIFAILAYQRAEYNAELTLQANTQREIARENENYAHWLVYASNLRLAQLQWDQDHRKLALHYLNQTRESFRGWEFDYLNTLFHSGFRSFSEPGYVTCAAYDPDGARIATGVSDNTIKIRDAESGALIHSLSLDIQNSLEVCLAFRPDGKRIVAGEQNLKTPIVFDVESGGKLLTLKGLNGLGLYCVAYSPDGTRIAGGGGVNRLILWDANTGDIVRRFEGHTVEPLPPNHHWDITTLAFSPDGRQLVSGSNDRTLILWNAETGEKIHTLKQHESDVSSVAFSPDGKYLASGSDDNTVIMWNPTTGGALRTFVGHTRSVTSVSFHPDGKLLVSGSYDDNIKVWETATAKEIRTLKGHTSIVSNVCFSPDGNQILSAGWDKTVNIFDATVDQKAHRVMKDGSSFLNYCLAFHPDGNHVAGGANEFLAVWDARSGRKLYDPSGYRETYYSLAYSPEGRFLIGGGWDHDPGGILKIWHAKSGAKIHALRTHGEDVYSLAVSPDGKIVAGGTTGGKDAIILWDIKTGREDSFLQWASRSDPEPGIQPRWESPDQRCGRSGRWRGQRGQNLGCRNGAAPEDADGAFTECDGGGGQSRRKTHCERELG